MTEKEYIKEVNKLLKMSYSPYSKFPVACILIDDKGNEFRGVNVEIAAYPLSTCAERNAITTAVTNGMKKIKDIYISANTSRCISPCGACRQIISEFSDKNTRVILGNSKNDEIKICNMDELLPYSFNDSDL